MFILQEGQNVNRVFQSLDFEFVIFFDEHRPESVVNIKCGRISDIARDNIVAKAWSCLARSDY